MLISKVRDLDYLNVYQFCIYVNMNDMKHIKQLTFDITQSRRIKNFAQKKKIPEKKVLGIFQNVMHIIHQAWKKNYGDSKVISFRDYFMKVMKYAEIEFRMHERQEEMKTITDHVEILRDALEEYERDYQRFINIENTVKELEGRSI